MGPDHGNGQAVEVAREAGNPQAAETLRPSDAKAVEPDRSRQREWLIRKRGYYYRPNRAGYTASVAEAGRYTEAEAKNEAALEPWHMTALHQSEVDGGCTVTSKPLVSGLGRDEWTMTGALLLNGTPMPFESHWVRAEWADAEIERLTRERNVLQIDLERAERIAALRADETSCTCPSGDGSLRWPCPVHPPSAERRCHCGKFAMHADMALITDTHGHDHVFDGTPCDCEDEPACSAVEPTCELSTSGAASFDKARARSPRRERIGVAALVDETYVPPSPEKATEKYPITVRVTDQNGNATDFPWSAVRAHSQNCPCGLCRHAHNI